MRKRRSRQGEGKKFGKQVCKDLIEDVYDLDIINIKRKKLDKNKKLVYLAKIEIMPIDYSKSRFEIVRRKKGRKYLRRIKSKNFNYKIELVAELFEDSIKIEIKKIKNPTKLKEGYIKTIIRHLIEFELLEEMHIR